MGSLAKKKMTLEEFRLRKMRETTPEGYVDSLMEQVVLMMLAFKEKDPNAFFEMPSTTFDEVLARVAEIRKKEAPQPVTGRQVNVFG